ncbi:MAG: DUF2207 domain-containing protein, partial [Balneolales bacterium]|nr:DUF2207 domain-containing protein [Balneolales bacterium]
MISKIPALIVIILSLLTSISSAKNYSIDHVTITAEVQRDGSIRYHESRTYSFDGSFSEKDYFLSRSGFDEVRDFTVAVNGIPSARDNSREAGTFR